MLLWFLYPEYRDWNTGLRISVEQQIALLAKESKPSVTGIGRVHRWLRKLLFLGQTLLSKAPHSYFR